jgi:hypothetical protein
MLNPIEPRKRGSVVEERGMRIKAWKGKGTVVCQGVTGVVGGGMEDVVCYMLRG